MTIKIVTEKIIGEQVSLYKKDIKYRGIVAISGVLSKPELPKQYLNMEYSFYGIVEDKIFYLYKGNGQLLLSSDILYSEESFQEILSFIKKAGDNLHKITRNWSGKEVFTI